jgi:hypothetical protein
MSGIGPLVVSVPEYVAGVGNFVRAHSARIN